MNEKINKAIMDITDVRGIAEDFECFYSDRATINVSRIRKFKYHLTGVYSLGAVY